MRRKCRRILMSADAVGGVWTYTLDLARALARHGIQITIATMGPLPSRRQMTAARAIESVDVITSEFKLEWMPDAWDDVRAAGQWLLEIADRVQPDIVHLNGYTHAALPFQAPVVIVGHSCMLSWADAIPGAIDASTLDVYKQHVQAGIRHADHVVAPSAAMMAALQTHYGPLPPHSVIPNGRHATSFTPGVKEPLIFTAGRLWDRAKNVDAVLNVAPRLPWEVVVAGDGREGVDGVRMLGRMEERELATWLARASIFVLPARYEPFGLLALEAALAGCALVLGDIPSQREVWGDAADYVDPDDLEALCQRIAFLASSPPDLHRRAAAARERARFYSIERMAESYSSLYRRLAAAGARDRSIACAS